MRVRSTKSTLWYRISEWFDCKSSVVTFKDVYIAFHSFCDFFALFISIQSFSFSCAFALHTTESRVKIEKRKSSSSYKSAPQWSGLKQLAGSLFSSSTLHQMFSSRTNRIVEKREQNKVGDSTCCILFLLCGSKSFSLIVYRQQWAMDGDDIIRRAFIELSISRNEYSTARISEKTKEDSFFFCCLFNRNIYTQTADREQQKQHAYDMNGGKRRLFFTIQQ